MPMTPKHAFTNDPDSASASLFARAVAETWRRVWWDGNFFRGPRFPILISFLVIDQVFRIFSFFYKIFRIFYYVQWRIWPFPHKNNHYFRKEFLYDTFFTLFVLLRVSDNTASQNIGGTDAWASPTSNFRGTVPQSPLGLRPCARATENTTVLDLLRRVL